MDYWKLVPLPGGWEESIFSRGKFIINAFGEDQGEFSSWFSCLETISANKNGLYWVWLAVTGCYPTKFEFYQFNSSHQVSGLKKSVFKLIQERAKNLTHSQLLMQINLVSPKQTELVDITHTSQMHYLTGIQRVVFGVARNVEGIATYMWVDELGILVNRNLDKSPLSSTEVFRKDWHVRGLDFLHTNSQKLEQTVKRRIVRSLALPIARKIKRYLIRKELGHDLKRSSNFFSENILIFNTRITIPEIPAPFNITRYEAILEESITPVQVILYDFVPIFHAWTVNPGNRGNLNLYLRIILLANRIVSISPLVHEQAKLITKAFRLERPEWKNRTQIFNFLALPSNFSNTKAVELIKNPSLVVMAGSLEPRKNHLQFLSALEILDKRGIEVDGVILGSAGWENSRIHDRIVELQKNGISISREGNLTDADMQQWIAKAQVLLQISEGEGFGLPIVEALSLGTKVIVSDISPLREWVGERVQAVKLGDAAGLADLISKILQSPERKSLPSTNESNWDDWIKLLYFTK